MNKNIKILVLVGAIILALLAYLFISFSLKTNPAVGDTAKVTTFTNSGTETASALISIPFLQSIDKSEIKIWIDRNNDDAFGDDETIINKAISSTNSNQQTGFYFPSFAGITDTKQAQIRVDGRDYRLSITFARIEMDTIFDLATITNPEEAMKGIGISPAHAEDPVEIVQEGVPDFDQRTGECAPTAAANSLTSLITRNGATPPPPREIIDELKTDMNWTAQNGVLPDNFVAGKNIWARRHNLPIVTEKVGNAHGTSTIDAIRDALAAGQAVELRLKFGDARTAQAAGGAQASGGHMVTVVGIHQGEGQTYLDINDPATPDSGTENVEIRGNTVVNYGPWSGIAVVSWGFTQTWQTTPGANQPQTTISSSTTGGMRGTDTALMVEVIEYSGTHITIDQLRVGHHTDGAGCPADHWHADQSVTAVDGRTFSDPNPSACGFGTLSEKPIVKVSLTP